jgi:hypothetical protein
VDRRRPICATSRRRLAASLISAVQNRIAELNKLRRRPPRGMLGAILDELATDQQTLAGLYGDQSTDDTQSATDAAASTFDNTAFSQQQDAVQALIARDQANGDTGALAQDQGSLSTLLGNRTSDLTKLLAGGGLNAATTDAINNELTSDYSSLAGLKAGSGGAVESADTQAQIAQLQQQNTTANRSAGLANAALSAFGSSGDIGSGGYANAYTSAQGSGPTINIQTLHPGDPPRSRRSPMPRRLAWRCSSRSRRDARA